jgi:predicted RNase H-like nuclease (RuvC/YqgF family)
MKTILFTVIAAFTIAGCANQPIAMKANNTYFAPSKVTTKSKAAGAAGVTKVTSVTSAQKKINEKETMIELLKKENKELRERIQRLEKKLQIQNS